MPRIPHAQDRNFPSVNPRRTATVFALSALCAGLSLTGCQVEDSPSAPARSEETLPVSLLIGGSNPVPGRIEAENYRTGGEGVAYHDNDPENRGGDLRTDGVDIKDINDGGAGYMVGWTEAGEWLDFSINVASAGTYKLTLRAASGASGTKRVSVSADGIHRGEFSTTDATGWQSWKNIVLNGVGLPAGSHTLRLRSNTGKLNLNYVDLVQTSTANLAPVANIAWQGGGIVGKTVTLDGSTSFDPDGRPTALTYAWAQIAGPTVSLAGATTARPTFKPVLAGTYTFRLTVRDGALSSSKDIDLAFIGHYIGTTARIQAEDYRFGGDLTPENLGGSDYRNDAVDIEVTADVGGGYNVGYIDAGEWLEFPVHVATSGSYTITARMASGQAGTKTMTLSMPGMSGMSGMAGVPISFTDASGWQSWRDVTVSGVNLTAGEDTLFIHMSTNGFNLNYVDVALGGPNQIVNSDFSNGLTGWLPRFDAPAAGTIANEAGSARVTIDNAGVNAYDIELAQHVSLVAGRQYTLEFDVKAQVTPKTFRIGVEHNVAPWTTYVNQAKTVTAAANAWQHYVVTWTQPETDAAAQVVFQCGAQNVNDLWVDNVTLR
jgi:hypothetical protein